MAPLESVEDWDKQKAYSPVCWTLKAERLRVNNVLNVSWSYKSKLSFENCGKFKRFQCSLPPNARLRPDQTGDAFITILKQCFLRWWWICGSEMASSGNWMLAMEFSSSNFHRKSFRDRGDRSNEINDGWAMALPRNSKRDSNLKFMKLALVNFTWSSTCWAFHGNK